MPAEVLDFEDGEVKAIPSNRPLPSNTSDSDDDALGSKRKHKKKDKDKDKDERLTKRHKDHKHRKKHKKERDDDDSDEEDRKEREKVIRPERGDGKLAAKLPERDLERPKPREERESPKREPERENRRSPERKGGRSRSRSRERRRSRSRDRSRRSPPRGGRSPPRYGRSPPRGGDRRGGYNDRGGGYRGVYDNRRGGYDQRRQDQRKKDDDHDRRRGYTEERRQDELRKEKEREEQEAIRRKQEEEEYAKRVAEQFEELEEIDDDIVDDEEAQAERAAEKARQERKARMEKIKADADKRAAEEAAMKMEEDKEEANKEPEESKPAEVANGKTSPLKVETVDLNGSDEEQHQNSAPDLLELAGLTPRSKGEDGLDSSESDEDDQRAGDVNELHERKKELKISPRRGGPRQEDAENGQQVFNMFDEDAEEAAVAAAEAKAKAIDRGDHLENFDDKEGYLTFQMGELFHERYEVNRVLGKGVFSTVLGAKDTVDGGNAAIKIIRNNDMMRKGAGKELEFLQLLAKDNGAGKHNIIQLIDDFVHHGHVCLVFEPMAMNLREVIKKFGHNRGINIEGVQVFAKQMFIGLKHLRKSKIVHADIKPDNILINERHNAIKICDFGSGSYINECDVTPYLVSRWYRAPEITLCLKYDYSIDLWSIAACLYELYVGKVMFPGNSNNDMLRRFMEIMGRFPNKLLKRSMTKQIELGRPVDFTEDFKFMRIMVDKITKKETVKIVTIEEKPVKDLMKLLMPTSLAPEQARKVKQLKDLLVGALALNPDNRFSIEQCLQSQFIKEPLGYVPKRKTPAVVATEQ